MISRAKRTAAFTIVELIVSIGLVLILMLGVSTVFKTISSTVAAGSSISDNTRVARAAQAVFANDFVHAVADKSAPFLTIHSSVRPAYRNRPDELSDAQTPTPYKNRQQLTIDLNGNNIEGEADAVSKGERISLATYNYRNHRTDILTFFVRDLVHRQAGNPGQNFVSSMTGSEAWVRYGHAQIWDGSTPLPGAGGFTELGPGATGTLTASTNPNNYFASQWLLSRSAIVLSDVASDGTIKDSSGTTQRYYQRGAGLTPLSTNSGADAAGYRIQESVLDLAGITMSGMRQVMLDYLDNATATNNYAQLEGWPVDFSWRPCANPLMPKPFTSQTLAQTVPVFVPGCTQFIVEYAGDFVAQENTPTSANYGQVIGVCAPVLPATPAMTDGVIDYVVINGSRQVRWYGLPRDTNGDGIAAGWQAGRTNNDLPDVVPLRDVMRTLGTETTNRGAPFERGKSPQTAAGQLLTPKPNYADTNAANSGLGLNDEYVCGWGPADNYRPKMIRITLVVDDPAGRNPNPEGQTFEYVFELP
jgi:type II secretory pathway pseudopilin PulG